MLLKHCVYIYIHSYQCSSVVCPSTVLNWLILLMQAGHKEVIKKPPSWVRLGLLKYSIQAPQVETSGFRGSARVHALKQWSVSFGVNFVENWITIGLWMDIKGYCRYCWHSSTSSQRGVAIAARKWKAMDAFLYSAHPRSQCWTSFSAAWWVWRLSAHTFRDRKWSRWFEMVMGWSWTGWQRMAERHQVSTVSCILLRSFEHLWSMHQAPRKHNEGDLAPACSCEEGLGPSLDDLRRGCEFKSLWVAPAFEEGHTFAPRHRYWCLQQRLHQAVFVRYCEDDQAEG